LLAWFISFDGTAIFGRGIYFDFDICLGLRPLVLGVGGTTIEKTAPESIADPA